MLSARRFVAAGETLMHNGKERLVITRIQPIGATRRTALAGLAITSGLVGSALASPPPEHAWTRYYSGPAGFYNNAKAAATDNAGNVYVTCESATGIGSAWATVKYSPSGVKQWERRYVNLANGSDRPGGLFVAPDGNVIVWGISDGSGTWQDYAVAKYAAADGAIIWQTRIDAGSTDGPSAAALDAAGDVYITGQSYSGVDYDWLTAKLDGSTGAILWSESIDGVSGGPDGINDAATAIAVDSAGNAYVTGWVQVSYDYSEEYNIYAYGAAKYDTNGNGQWFVVLGDENDPGQPTQIAVAGDGNVVLTGQKYPVNTYKLNASSGSVMWENDYQGPGGVGAFPYAIGTAPDGDVIVTGSVCAGSPFCDESHATWKLDNADGSIVWDSTYTAPEGDRAGGSARAMTIDADGNVMTTGFYIYFGRPGPAVTRFITAAGEERWIDIYLGDAPGAASTDAVNFGIAYAPSSKALYTVGTEGRASASFMTTVKYPTVCPADYDLSGFVDFDDFNKFVIDFELGIDAADFDGSGFVDFDDFNAFVQAFEIAC